LSNRSPSASGPCASRLAADALERRIIGSLKGPGDDVDVPSGYLTYPWKITMLLIGKPSISMSHFP